MFRRDQARDAVRGAAATFARFSSMKGSPMANLPAPLQKATAFLREYYDMREHTRASSEHARAMENDFVDWFTLCGPVERVRPRVEGLRDLGLDFIYFVTASTDTPRDIARASLANISEHILPVLQR